MTNNEITYTLTAKELELVISCLTRAENEGAFTGCARPSIGKKAIAMLDGKRNADK